MRRWDANRNGMLDAAEISDGRTKYYAERVIQRAGLKPTFPISIARIEQGLKKSIQSSGSKSSSGSGNSSQHGRESDSSDDEPLVPGFGVQTQLDAPPAFGERGPDDSSGTSRYASRSAPRSDSSSESGSSHDHESRERGDRDHGDRGPSSQGDHWRRVRDHAQALIKQYDKNGNYVLEKSEWQKMSKSHWSADGNHDGKITVDEMTRWLDRYSRNRSSGRDSSGSEKRPTYRSLKPTERLSDDLPDWFVEKDANGDGQVTMAEYASEWTDSKVDDFAQYDPSRDGVITPHECLAAEEEEDDEDE